MTASGPSKTYRATTFDKVEQRKPHGPLADGTEPMPETLKRLTNNVVKELERKLVLDALRANHRNRNKTVQVLNIGYRVR